MFKLMATVSGLKTNEKKTFGRLLVYNTKIIKIHTYYSVILEGDW